MCERKSTVSRRDTRKPGAGVVRFPDVDLAIFRENNGPNPKI
jgi:hypothetical protein